MHGRRDNGENRVVDLPAVGVCDRSNGIQFQVQHTVLATGTHGLVEGGMRSSRAVNGVEGIKERRSHRRRR